MIRKTLLSMVVVAGMLGGIGGASAQMAGKSMTCGYPWCVNYVEVSPSGAATVYWNEMRMANRLTGATIAWMLVGAPDYELRADSVVITGPNAPGSAAVFPLRQVLADRYSLDDMNTNSLTYTYDIRVYKKGSPTPVTTTGVIVNSNN